MENARGYALITGATSGIGYELAKLFADDGFNLVIVARTEEDLQKVAAELQTAYAIEVQTFSKDLFQPTAAAELYQEVKAKGITVEVLVSDAGQGQWGAFAETDLQRDLDIIQLNITSLVTLTKLFLNDMLQRGSGKILQVSSLVGQTPAPLLAVYAATKAFVLRFFEALINELKDTGVTLTVLQPGATEKDFFRKAEMETTYEYQEASHAEPKNVAFDGYDALMNGESRVISGLKNKVQAAMSNVVPDASSAANMRKHMEESDQRNRPIKGGGDSK